MRILVQKFGGAVLSDTERVKAAAGIVARAVRQGYSVVAVASAMGDTTNRLLGLTGDFSLEESPRELDLLLSSGEQISASLLAIALNSNGLHARAFTGGQAGIYTDDVHGSASIKNVETENLLKCLSEGTVAVVTGYQGITSTNEITTLGRGGSDTTAIALAVALKAERCDVYKDVCGIFSADPKLCDSPVKLQRMSLSEMRAFSNAGAQVLCPAAMEIAVRNNVTLRVRSVYMPNDEGTLIGGETHSLPFCGIACEDKLDVFSANPAHSLSEAKAMNSLLHELTVYGASAELVRKICKKTQRRRYLAVGNRHVHNTHQIIAESTKRHGIKTDFRKSLAKLSLVGEFENPAYTMHRAVNVLLKEQICPRFFCLEGSVRLSLLLPQSDVKVATELLHDDFMNDNQKRMAS
jgi:aspartate kinase